MVSFAYAAFVRLNTSLFMFVRSIYVVFMFKIFRNPFSWTVSHLGAAAFVGCIL